MNTSLLPTVPTETMVQAVEDITFRLKAVELRYRDYDPACNRRWTAESMFEVGRHLQAVQRWLDGTNDTPIVWIAQAATQEGRDTYRTHYAADSLVQAEVKLLAAEVYAGIRTREEAEALSPWKVVDGRTTGEAERLRLSEGITWTYPASVLP